MPKGMKELDNELINQIIDFPGLGGLSATEILQIVRFIKAGIRGLI